VIKETSSV